MNLTIDREILLENLNIVSRGLPVKSPMPILTGIKLYATDKDLFLTASNSDISVEVIVNDSSLKIEESGQTVVPGRFFIDIIRKVNSKTISLYLAEDKILVLKADRGEYNLHIMDALDYPKIDFVSQTDALEVSSNLVREIVKTSVFATSQSEKKPILTGVNLKNDGTTLTLTATDSFRLSQKKISIPEYKQFNITVPAKSLVELEKAIDAYQENVKLYFSENKMLVSFKNVSFQTRLLDGNYPATDKLIPSSFPIELSFNKDELALAVERVSLLSPRDTAKDKEITYSIIKLSLKKDRLVEISTNNAQIGAAREELIPTNILADQPITIGFSSRYLIEALRSFTSTNITLYLSGEIRPFIIRGEEDSDLTQLILPVRMN